MRLKEEMENSQNSSVQQVQMIYECEICCVAFQNLSDFQIHRIFEHSRNLGLTYAIRENVSLSYRKQDLGNTCVTPNNTSKADKSEKNYECGICKRMFSILDDLCNHLEIHNRLSKNRQEGKQSFPTPTRIIPSPTKSSACKTVKHVAPPTFLEKLEGKNQTNDGLSKRRADDSSANMQADDGFAMKQADDKKVKRLKKRHPDQSGNKYYDVTKSEDKNAIHVLEKENREEILNERENQNSKKISKDVITKKDFEIPEPKKDFEKPEPKKCSPLQARVVVNKARKTVPHNSTRNQPVNNIVEALNGQLNGEDAKHNSFTNDNRESYISNKKHELTQRVRAKSLSALAGFKSVEDDLHKTRSTGKRAHHEEDVFKTDNVPDKDKTFKWCQFCNRKYSSYQKLKQHLSTVHNNNKKFMCSLCCKVFRSKYHLNRHEAVHSVVKAFHCIVCWKQFSNERRKWQHEANRHGISSFPIRNSKLDM